MSRAGLQFETDHAMAGRALEASGNAFERELLDAAFELESEAAAARQARKQFNRLQKGYARRLGVNTHGQVHHAIELQALERFPGVFTSAELNSFRNMRGIPRELPAGVRSPSQVRDRKRGQRQLHNAKIREIWDRHYANLNREIQARRLRPNTPAYNDFVRRYLTAARAEIDYVLGQFFTENRTGRPQAFL
ncbi:MAG: hypothetical protein HRU78_03690 [Gammaproteobacteria bacterium]|nr:MAG: hypothetical protein HRU78_03690 [Gammaproteobacteria bacterium]